MGSTAQGAWREFLRESGDVREGETEADASRRVARGPDAL
jgi:hypothetical protein